MTNNQLTKEWLQGRIANMECYGVVGDEALILQVYRIALAAMDSEPVAWTESCEITNMKETGLYLRGFPDNSNGRDIPLYRHAQPAPEYPETLPCPVLLEPGMRFGKGVKTRLVLDAIQRRAEHYAELGAMTPEERAEYDDGIEAFKAMLPQPEQVVPEKAIIGEMPFLGTSEGVYVRGWNDCRAAMLQAEPVTTANKLPFEQWLSQQTGTIDVECGCVMTEVFFHWLRVAYEAGNSPVIPDGYVMVPKEPTEEMNKAGWAAMNEHDAINPTYRAMLAAAPQEVKHG